MVLWLEKDRKERQTLQNIVKVHTNLKTKYKATLTS